MVSGLNTRMTTQRLVRAGRSRFFIGLGVLVLTVGFVAIFHSSQQDLDELRRLETHCELKKLHLSQQLTDAEETIRSGRHEMQMTQLELLRRTRESRELREKTLSEANTKFGALQQGYKLLKSQNDDLVELRLNHVAEQDALEAKLQIAAAQHRVVLQQKEEELKGLKSQLSRELDRARSSELSFERQLQDFRSHCSWRPPSATDASAPRHSHTSSRTENGHNFNAQLPVSGNLYVMVSNNSTSNNNSHTTADVGLHNSNNLHAIVATTVAATLSNHTKLLNTIPTNTLAAINAADRNAVDGVVVPATRMIINSVENFQIVPKLAAAAAGGEQTQGELSHLAPPSSTTTLRSEAAAANVPSLSSSSSNALPKTAVASTTDARPKRTRQIPAGVVPIPASEMLGTADESPGQTMDAAVSEKSSSPSTVASSDVSQENNRYANVMSALGGADEAAAAVGPISDAAAAAEADNGAHEVMDTNDFLMDGHSMGHKDHMQLVLEDKQLDGGVGAMGAAAGGNNAAEEDANGAEAAAGMGGMVGRGADKEQNEVEDSAILIGANGGGGGGGGGSSVNGVRKIVNDQKLINEIDADLGKVAGYQDDAHPEDAMEEDDDDEYANLAARKMDPAVRN